MSEYVSLKFNPECLNIYQSGGVELENDYWMIIFGIIIVVIIIFFILSYIKKTDQNVNSTSVTITKKSVDGEDVYYKEVDGDEQELTEEDKLQYDKMFEKNESVDDLELDDLIDDASDVDYID